MPGNAETVIVYADGILNLKWGIGTYLAFVSFKARVQKHIQGNPFKAIVQRISLTLENIFASF